VRRAVIAAAWIVGTIVPLVAGAVFLFGCCVLPFHAYLHRAAMPLCALASGVAHHGDAQQSSPAREKQEPVKRVASRVPRSSLHIAPAIAPRAATASDANGYRSFIAHGALRCDRDVGLHLLDGTLLI
jgi:hypothetical protein